MISAKLPAAVCLYLLILLIHAPQTKSSESDKYMSNWISPANEKNENKSLIPNKREKRAPQNYFVVPVGTQNYVPVQTPFVRQINNVGILPTNNFNGVYSQFPAYQNGPYQLNNVVPPLGVYRNVPFPFGKAYLAQQLLAASRRIPYAVPVPVQVPFQPQFPVNFLAAQNIANTLQFQRALQQLVPTSTVAPRPVQPPQQSGPINIILQSPPQNQQQQPSTTPQPVQAQQPQIPQNVPQPTSFIPQQQLFPIPNPAQPLPFISQQQSFPFNFSAPFPSQIQQTVPQNTFASLPIQQPQIPFNVPQPASFLAFNFVAPPSSQFPQQLPINGSAPPQLQNTNTKTVTIQDIISNIQQQKLTQTSSSGGQKIQILIIGYLSFGVLVGILIFIYVHKKKRLSRQSARITQPHRFTVSSRPRSRLSQRSFP